MPWSQNGGGWKGGAGGPWGQGPGGGNPPPDLEEILRRSQDKLRQAVPGGVGFFGTSIILLILAAGIAYFGFTVRINPDERAVVQRFGKFDRELGERYKLPLAVSGRGSHRHSLYPPKPG